MCSLSPCLWYLWPDGGVLPGHLGEMAGFRSDALCLALGDFDALSLTDWSSLSLLWAGGQEEELNIKSHKKIKFILTTKCSAN